MVMRSAFYRMTPWLTQRSLATPPSVWGKLPTQGDFVHLRASLAEQRAWHQWVQSVWSPCLGRRQQTKSPDRNWLNLDVQRTSYPPELPIAFVMPAGHLPTRPNWMVQGVLMPSHDKVGRPCPLVIYQLAHPKWAARLWSQDAAVGAQHLLYWWARLASVAVRAPLPWSTWAQHVDEVWAAHEPGFAQLLGGRAPPKADTESLEKLLGPVSADDPAGNLCGVEHLPWPDWPHRTLRQTQPVAAFWTQDLRGGYVHAASSLNQLWRQQ